eukprot:1159325-Lingulodinium_polyedra.AAC.1
MVLSVPANAMRYRAIWPTKWPLSRALAPDTDKWDWPGRARRGADPNRNEKHGARYCTACASALYNAATPPQR